jgi:hypothetical protein
MRAREAGRAQSLTARSIDREDCCGDIGISAARNAMKSTATSDPWKIRVGALIEEALPPVEDLHARALSDGFRAWENFLQGRLDILPVEERAEEKRLLLLLCREEFCSFDHYSRELGGDGYRLPQLEARRAILRDLNRNRPPPAYTCILKTDTMMRRDHEVATTYARTTNAAASVQLRAERTGLEALLAEHMNGSLDLHENLIRLVQRELADAGFGAARVAPGGVEAERPLVGEWRLHATLRVSRGESALDYLRDVDFTMRLVRGRDAPLPLRISGLAPDLQAYTLAIFADGMVDNLSTASPSGPGSLTISSRRASLPPDDVVYSYYVLGIRCLLRFLAYIQDALVRTCAMVGTP